MTQEGAEPGMETAGTESPVTVGSDSDTMGSRESFLAGVRAVAPIIVGIVPFGLVAGAAAVNAGLTLLDAVGLSVVVFAGASQLAAIGLFGDGAPLALVVVTVLVINLRLVMYSASIAPELLDEPRRWRALSAYLLTDQAYALSVTRYSGSDPDSGSVVDAGGRLQYYLAVAGALWVVWQAGSIVGIVVGARVPPAWGLEFAVPLVFLSLLVPATTSWPKLAAAAVGGGVAVAGAVLTVPLNLGLIAGGAAGVATGVLVDDRLADDTDDGHSDGDAVDAPTDPDDLDDPNPGRPD